MTAASGNGHHPDAADILDRLGADTTLRELAAVRGQPADMPPDIGPDMNAGTGTARRPDSWTAAELMTMDFPPPRWAVPGIIPEGATLLVGAPKTGKSWLALGLAVAVAMGGKALGSIEVEPGPVLSPRPLEDTPRRLKDRLARVLAGAAPPPWLRFAVDWPPLSAGGTCCSRSG